MSVRYSIWLATAVLLCTPLAGAAESLSAGFAPTSIFVSQKKITEGESVNIYTVLYNSSEENFSGDVVFTIDGKTVGSRHVTIATGEAQTPFITWTAVKGTHSASAHMEKIVGSDSGITLAENKTDTITLNVAAAPPPTAQAQAASNASNIISEGTSHVAPVANTAFNALENIRKEAAEKIDTALAKTASKNDIKVSADSFKSVDNAQAAASGLLDGAWRYLLQGLLFICNMKVLFYVVLLVVVYLLFRVIMAFFRSRRY